MHSNQLSTSRLSNEVAQTIFDAFAEYHYRFREVTRRAGRRFADSDWHGLQSDARERLDIRDRQLQRLLVVVRAALGDRLHSRMMWVGIKAVYSGLIASRDDWEIAETFFNSVTRRVFTTVGIDPEIEFVHTDYAAPPTPAAESVYRSYQAPSLVQLLRSVLAEYPSLATTPEKLQQDAKRIADRVAAELPEVVCRGAALAADFARAVFYRGRNAYLMGRLKTATGLVPLVLCFTNEGHPAVDAVLFAEDDVSLLFSFTRSYFLVDSPRPYDMVQFVQSLIPRKRVAEIYISLGYNKHGKTELYRNALRHLAKTDDLYQLAEGNRGMVMVVFTRPSYPVVFKIIRDRFEYPKDCSHQSVIDHYQMVFRHDRAGRLVDAQEYEYLVLDRRRFAEELLEELHEKVQNVIEVQGNRVIIKHCYAERRVTPLNLYLQQVDSAKARAAVIDYGQAIKDLALTNLFPGDLLPKNFGVTRFDRVVFYDYDDICMVTDCNFRHIPQSQHYDDELSAEPWFSVGPQDIFPEEFINFLGLSPEHKRVFLDYHADLLDADYWNHLKEQLATGELFHVPPYAPGRRLNYSPEQTRDASTATANFAKLTVGSAGR